METNKDFLLRELQKLAKIFQDLLKIKPSVEEVDVFIDDFCIVKFSDPLNIILKKPINEIINIIENSNIENIKDFADILYIRHNMYPNFKDVSNLIIDLYEVYLLKSKTFSFEIMSKIELLKKLETLI